MDGNPSRIDAPRRLSDVLSEGKLRDTREVLTLVSALAADVAALHVSGRTHRAIGIDAITLDDRMHPTLAPPPASSWFGDGLGDDELCPPQLSEIEPIELVASTEAAAEALRVAGIRFDPRWIDVYQLGALTCRLLSSESIVTYLQSPTTIASIAPEFRPLVDRALGFDAADRFQSAEQFADAARALLPNVEDGGELHDAAAGSEVGVTTPDSARDKAKRDTSVERQAPDFTSDTAVDKQSARANPPGDDLPFMTLGHYEVVGRIGHGGMGDVYEGYERALDRKVAIKVLPSELSRQEDFVQRFRAEATAAAQLAHPNIVQIHFIGDQDGHHYFAMHYVEGESLAERLSRRGRLDIDQVLAIVEQILSALAAAHNRGLIHRDIKPGNILLDRATHRALLGDFGLVKSLGSSGQMTATGVIMGTVDYISPEQGRGQPVDARSDLYSFGVLMYHMLSGRLPFEADSATAMIFQHVYEQPIPLEQVVPEVPGELATIVARLMKKNPEERYSDAESVLEDVRAFRAGEPLISLRPAELSPRRESSVGRGSQRKTVIVEAPRFAEFPEPVATTSRSVAAGWWPQLRDRVANLFQEHAPEIVKQLQNTQQQVGGAVLEYERREMRLRELLNEASQVAAEIESQIELNRAALRSLEQRDAVGDDDQVVLDEQRRKYQENIAELESHSRQQSDQIDEIEAQLVQIAATLAQLRSQRDLLLARLKTAEAKAQIMGGRRARRIPRRLKRIAVAGTFTLVGLAIWGASALLETREGLTVAPTVPGEAARTFAPDAGEVSQLTFTPDGQYLLTTHADAAMRLWGVESGELLESFKGHTEPELRQPKFSSNGKYFVSGGADNTLRWWRTWVGRQEKIFDVFTGKINDLDISPDGELILAGTEKALWLVDSESNEVLIQDGDAGAHAVAFLSDASHVLSAGTDSRVTLWDVPNRLRSAQYTGHVDDVMSMAISPDGTKMLTGSRDTTVRLWEMATGRTIRRLVGHVDEVVSVGFGDEGRRAASLSKNGTMTIWDLEVGIPIHSYGGTDQMVISPDGKFALRADAKDFTLRVIDVASAREVGHLGGHKATVTSLAFARGGRIAASGSLDGTAHVWAVADDYGPQKPMKPAGYAARQSSEINGFWVGSEIDIRHNGGYQSIKMNDTFDMGKSWTLSLQFLTPGLVESRQQLVFWGDSRPGMDVMSVSLLGSTVTAYVMNLSQRRVSQVEAATDGAWVDRWVPIVLRYDAELETLSLYLDGQLIGSQDCPFAPGLDREMPFTLGDTGRNGGQQFRGSIRATWLSN